MKISLDWLSDFLPTIPPAQALADALTHGGLPVEVIEPHGTDTVIDVEVTSNRPDCLSHLGVARELAALLNLPINEPVPPALSPAGSAPQAAVPTVTHPALCPTYTARVVSNVKIAPSPAWLARRLQAMGLRPINNVVDITNYVLFELGQPLHAFDLDKLQGPITVRPAAPGEKLTTLDGRPLTLNPSMLVIADAARPVALAGVMGGQDTEVTPATTNILLESARFDPLTIRQTARALSMKSDSSYRFERGLDPTLAARASDRAAQLLADLAGGTPGPLLSAPTNAPPPTPRPLTLRLPRIPQVLGTPIDPNVALTTLSRLRLSPTLATETITVTIPPDRLDLNLEIDLIEEVARLIGYDQIPTRDEIPIRLTPPDPAAKAHALLTSTLVSAGYFEAVTFSFVTDALATDFLPPAAAGLPRVDPAVRKADARLRPSLLPGLLEAVRRNESVGTPDAQLFETGSAFWLSPAGHLQEHRRLAFVGSPDLHALRGTVELLLHKLNATAPLRFTPADRPGFAPGSAARVEWNNAELGYLGLVSPDVAAKLSLRHAPAAAELELTSLLANFQPVPQLKPLPRYPAIRRDLSFILPEPTRYQQLEQTIRQTNPPHLEDIEYVTTYRGKPLEKGTKSLTVTLIFRSPKETLTADQVESAVSPILQAATTTLNATLRT